MKTSLFLCLAVIGLTAPTTHAQHGHLNVGARSTSQNSALYFDNGEDFAIESGYIKTLTYTNGGRFAGYFEGNITLTVLPATEAHAGPDPAAPALGSLIQFGLACLEGPDGGSFQFWDAGTTNPTVSLAPGQSSSNLFLLTESDGSPGADPYGHFHGRRFTATKPGIYKIGFRAFDTSTNGVAAGPIHAPSPEFAVHFQAGINVASIHITHGVNSISFGSLANWSFALEASTDIANPSTWLPVGQVVPGNDYIQTIEDPAPTPAPRFYRIKATPQ